MSPSKPPAWRKSTRSSDPEQAQCVEVAEVDAGVSCT